jgi:small subunit ribosomal protein S9
MMADEERPEGAKDAEDTPAAEETPAAEQDSSAAAQASEPEHAVPSEEAEEIASVVEDAPLEAFEEAQEAAAAQSESEQPPVAEPQAPAASAEQEPAEEDEPAPRAKPAVPGAHLEVDIVPEGVDPLGRGQTYEDPYAIDEGAVAQEGEAGEREQDEEDALAEPIATAAIDLASGARYRATGKRKTAIARVTLRPGSGAYLVNGRTLEQHFPRLTVQRNIRQPLETVGYQDRMDVVARLHGGGISAQAGALRHGVSRALLEADPNLRGELKRRGFLTRDSRAKERKKAGLKKARKRPQFSKR